MTISTTHTQNLFNGNGVTTAFVFTFQILDSTHLEALISNVVQSSSGYSVALNANQESSPGGTLTFNVAPTTGTNNVKIRRKTPLTQASAFSREAKLDTDKLETILDKLTLITQELDSRLTTLGG